MTACKQSEQFPHIEVEYPETVKEDISEEFFGEKVADPFRWLEDDRSPQTANWVSRQNEATFKYLKQIPFRDTVRKKFDKMVNYERYSALPLKKNGKYYYMKNSGLQNHSVLYVSDSKEKEGEVFLDPNTFSEDGTTALGELKFSENGAYCAYSISEGGSDWRKIIVMDVGSRNVIEDTIVNVKFSGIHWNKNDGFFYSSYNKPKKGSLLSAMTMSHKLYYHKLGTPQSSDKLVFGEEIRRRYVGAVLFDGVENLFVTAAEGTSGNEVYVQRNIKESNEFIAIAKGFDNDHELIYADNDFLYMATNYKAANRRVVKVDLNNPSPENWEELVPERKQVIETISVAGRNIFINYLKNASSMVCQFDLEGNEIRQVELPGIGSVSGFRGEDEDTEVFFEYRTFTAPMSIYALQIENGKTELFKAPKLNVDCSQYETRQVFYTSKDGTKVSMFIVCKKGTELNGQNPTLLYGYGGFDISLTPSFSFRWLGWLEMGGVFALANLRGGGEYGKEWHKAGTKLQKQNVFDDFIAAAEYLQESGYTSKDKLTLMGGSNGGLLVGAVSTQRPDLFRVALPAVGVMDMLRYHKFTSGAGWISDYGCADSSKVMFEYLLGYSPVHNVKEGVSYPATLVTTADHDDRVVPAHSFKYAAQLQDKQTGELPVLIRVDTKAGHGAGKSVSMFLDELADIFSFAFYNMNEYPDFFKE